MDKAPDPERLNDIVFIEDEHDDRKFTERDLLDFIRNTYQPPEYVVLDHVRNATGFVGNVRTADALMFSTYPSRGLYVYGIEIKCSRQDWLSEMRNPSKAEEIGRYCDYWYVVSPRGIVRPGELPRNWGLLVPKVTLLEEVDKPVRNENCVPITREFLASIMRRLHEQARSRDELSKEFGRGVERGKEIARRELAKEDPIARQLERELERVRDCMKRFQDASGIDISDIWTAGRVGKVVKFLTDEGFSIETIMGGLHRDAKQLLEISEKYKREFNIRDR